MPANPVAETIARLRKARDALAPLAVEDEGFMPALQRVTARLTDLGALDPVRSQSTE